ncbi:hypothetical protein AcV5_010270 [Taiwanofungus camphoratus]|nr:hypothetical protein AcV5_010270 [Antrodia cinnamomea]
MFSHNPYTSYSSRAEPAYHDTEYLRALAHERAARRAQEEARERVARARLAHQAYSPYDYELDAYDNEFGDGYPAGAYGYAVTPCQKRALMEEQRRREILERERARKFEQEQLRLETEERWRRIIEEERRRRMEEEELRRLLEEEQRRRDEELRARWRADPYDPFLRSFGWRPVRADEDEVDSRTSRTPLRSHTASPPPRRRRMPTQSGYLHPDYVYETGPTSRSASMPPRAPSKPGSIPIKVSSPKCQPSPRTPSPLSKPGLTREVAATLEQHDAARKIQKVFRAHIARRHALQAIADLRVRFAALRAGFVAPTVLDFALHSGQVSVPVDPDVLSLVHTPPAEETERPVREGVEEGEGRPMLAYTTANAPVHAYEEELNRLLGALDAVESRGDAGVREARKQLVREVESEAERVEKLKSAVWQWWIGKREQLEAGEPASTDADREVRLQASPTEGEVMEMEVAAESGSDVLVEEHAMEDRESDEEKESDVQIEVVDPISEPDTSASVSRAEPAGSQPQARNEVDAELAMDHALQSTDTRTLSVLEELPDLEMTTDTDKEPAERDRSSPFRAHVEDIFDDTVQDGRERQPEIDVVEAGYESDDEPESVTKVGESMEIESPRSQSHKKELNPWSAPDVKVADNVQADEAGEPIDTEPTPLLEQPSAPDANASNEQSQPTQSDHSSPPRERPPSPKIVSAKSEPSADQGQEQQSESPVHLHPALSGSVQPVSGSSMPVSPSTSQSPPSDQNQDSVPALVDVEMVEHPAVSPAPVSEADLAHVHEQLPSPITEEPDAEADAQRVRPATPVLSHAPLDGDSEPELEVDDVRTPPVYGAEVPDVQPPVIVVTPVDVEEPPAGELVPDGEEEKRGVRPSLVNQDWREVEEFDML